MTPDELRARLLAALRVEQAERQAGRPAGLTASAILGCHSYGARKLVEEPEASSSDVLRSWRGMALHEAMGDTLARLDPDFRDGRTERFTWDPGNGLPIITGAFDFALADMLVELKTSDRDICRRRADHGAEPQHAAQVSVAATALGYAQAAVVYLPTDAGEDDLAVCPVDVAHWTREAVSWLERIDVRADITQLIERGVPVQEATRRVLDGVDRDKPYSWCSLICGMFKDCRGDYGPPPDLEITDPDMRAAALDAVALRERRLADRKEAAAKAVLRHVEGVVHDGEGVVRVSQQVVAPSGKRRGFVRTTVERRSE